MKWYEHLFDFLAGLLAQPKGDYSVGLVLKVGSGHSMKNVELRRIETGDAGTFGILEANGKTFYTLELPDRDNLPGLSCIPAGEYYCSWDFSPAKQHDTYRLQRVPNRSGILIHSANWAGDRAKGLRCQLDGCIALGMDRGDLEGQPAILRSREAVADFEDRMGRDTFILRIVGP